MVEVIVLISYILLVSLSFVEGVVRCGVIDKLCCLDNVDIVWCSAFLSLLYFCFYDQHLLFI